MDLVLEQSPINTIPLITRLFWNFKIRAIRGPPVPEMIFSQDKDALNIPYDSGSNVAWSPSTPLFSKTPKSSMVKGQKISKGNCGV